MKTIKLFAALCAIAALGVSCQKEVPVQNEEEQIVVPEGMEYVFFEVGVPTKINGYGPISWNSDTENVSVLAIVDGKSKVYRFQTEETSAVAETKTISGFIDVGANLKFVVYPHNANYKIDFEEDPSGNTICMPNRGSYGFSNNNGVSSQTPFACKIQCSGGELSAVSKLQPLFSSLKVTLPERLSDHIPGYRDKDQATSLVDSLYITGKGISGQVYVDFSGDNAVTSLKNTPSTQTIKVELKRNTTSGLPSTGYYYIPIAPCFPETLDIRLTHTPGSDGIEYADYTFHFGANTFTQGKVKSITLTAPYVKTAETVSAIIDGTTLTMNGTAEFFTGTKVTVDNYNFGFSYREKGTADWTTVSAAYDLTTEKFTASETVDPTKTYEVKAFAVAPGAIKTKIAEGQYIIEDMKIEGEIVESKGYLPDVVVTIDKFSLNQYGTDGGGYWKYLGDDTEYTYPTKSGVRPEVEDSYAYYAEKTDMEPLISGVKMKGGKNGYYFSGKLILHYGAGYFEFPGKEGLRISKIDVKIKSSSSDNKDYIATNTAANSVSWKDGAYQNVNGTGAELLAKDTYTTKNVEQTIHLNCLGSNESEGIRIWGGAAFNHFSFEITYTQY